MDGWPQANHGVEPCLQNFSVLAQSVCTLLSWSLTHKLKRIIVSGEKIDLYASISDSPRQSVKGVVRPKRYSHCCVLKRCSGKISRCHLSPLTNSKEQSPHKKRWSRVRELNPRPFDYQSNALPRTEFSFIFHVTRLSINSSFNSSSHMNIQTALVHPELTRPKLKNKIFLDEVYKLHQGKFCF